jgi:hypothetical protein
MAYCSSAVNERWGIIEIDSSKLVQSRLFADNSLLNNGKKKCTKTWGKSLTELGFCLHSGTIPLNAIRRISIYNPFSNWLITKEILYTNLGKEFHETNLNKNRIITKWFMGEFVSLEEWIGERVVAKQEREEIQIALDERSGLDIFYHGDN